MRITIEHLGMKTVVEDEAVIDICDAIDLVEKGFQKIGYAQERIEGGFVVKAKQIQGEL